MKEDLNKYQGAYNTAFKFYDENQWFLSKYANYLISTFHKENYSSILSLGIGHEVVGSKLVELFGSILKDYEIVEGSPEIIKEFKSKKINENVKVHEAYFENFETSKKFDVIEMGFVLEHVDNPEIVINRFKDFLTPNGTMCIAVPNARSLHRLIGHKAGLLDDMNKLSPYDLELGHKRYFDLDTISKTIEKCGLNIVSKKGLMLKPITSNQIKELKWDRNIIDALVEIGEEYPEISNCLYLEARK